MLALAFETKELRTLCEEAECAYNEYGERVMKALINRLADLRAASNILDLPFVEHRAANGSEPEHVRVHLEDGRYLVVVANHPRLISNQASGVSWAHVNRVKILRVE